MHNIKQQRVQKLQTMLVHSDIDHLLIIDTTSIDYLIGRRFHPGERFLGLLIGKQGKPVLFLNRLFPCLASDSFEIVDINDGDDVVGLIQRYCPKSLAVDDHLPAYLLLPLINKVPGICLGSKYVNELRLIKDEDEQNKMQAASKLNDEVMKEVEAFLQVGIKDFEVEERIHDIHRRLGVKASFPPIVAFRNIASDPHGSADGQILQEDDCVVIDMGLVLDDYCSDMTRTFLFGNTDMKEIYDIVKTANEAAIAMIRPGVRFCDVDKAARTVIEQAGYGEYFTHRTGHGIGLDIHEPMDVSQVNEEVLRPGMCFSVEPGIYLPGRGGVRIEDLVIVTKDGVKVLNQYAK